MVASVPIAVAPDVFAIARRLALRPGLSVLASTAHASRYGGFSYVACEPNATSGTLDPLGGAEARFERGPFSHAPRFVGVLPFEAFRSLERRAWSQPERRPAPRVGAIQWQRYDAVVAVEHATDRVLAVGESDAAVRALARLVEQAPDVPEPAFRFSHADDQPKATHLANVNAAIAKIVAGDLYQVNLARRLSLRLEPADAQSRVALLRSLCAAFPSPFGALLRAQDGDVIASTPELLLDASPSLDRRSFDRLTTEPIKGTRQRAVDPDEDAELARELDHDPKERAELAMIIDVERNDLARVCVPGSVAVEVLPHVVSHSTVHHRLARVVGRARAGVSRHDVLTAMLPSGSVTGAPKVRAMELIAELEPMRRGVYTGGFGLLGFDGSLRLAMAIRALVIGPAGDGEYLVGGGIVASSDPDRELSETGWKSTQLDRLGGSKE